MVAHIVAQDIVVEFPIYGGTSRSLKNTFVRAATGGLLARDVTEKVIVRALNGLSFEFTEGDRVGVVGHNGSGKTTLLRVLAGAYEPASGSVDVVGKVVSMLSIMLGLNMEATGFENIFIRGALLGLRRREIEPLAREIIEFAELGDYIHMPVRTYSSGMAMRLTFAVATSITGDIILMDEWLSAGDASFASKAQKRLQRLLDQAKILVLASHNENLIRGCCNKIMHLEHGAIVELETI